MLRLSYLHKLPSAHLSLMTTNTSLVYADSQENHKQHQMEGMPNHEMPSSSNKVVSQEPQMAHSVIGANPSVDKEEHGSHKDDSHERIAMRLHLQ